MAGGGWEKNCKVIELANGYKAACKAGRGNAFSLAKKL